MALLQWAGSVQFGTGRDEKKSVLKEKLRKSLNEQAKQN